ncbi:hypothetical protein K402DRAFT_44749 [Aulographum hederae CBS 113979]|uniref:Uncharacterized protein n=1 Tax=Aulographum hederae CBS 113979 TaxID=1176131 RepID=A0A6G1H417_9PEZI|nr:hypothetical protein K402DRAFT_44749 [Aulographum hederae CBS 113979]
MAAHQSMTPQCPRNLPLLALEVVWFKARRSWLQVGLQSTGTAPRSYLGLSQAGRETDVVPQSSSGISPLPRLPLEVQHLTNRLGGAGSLGGGGAGWPCESRLQVHGARLRLSAVDSTAFVCVQQSSQRQNPRAAVVFVIGQPRGGRRAGWVGGTRSVISQTGFSRGLPWGTIPIVDEAVAEERRGILRRLMDDVRPGIVGA